MLPGIHSLLASIAVITAIAIGAFGVAGASRGVPTAIPLEAWRSVAPFEERVDWNPFANPDIARRFQVLTALPEPEPESAEITAIAGAALDLPAFDGSQRR